MENILITFVGLICAGFLSVLMFLIFLAFILAMVGVTIEIFKDCCIVFWELRIAWREGKEKYRKYIESHK